MKDLIKHILSINLNDLSAYDRLFEIFISSVEFPFNTIPIIKDSTIYRSRRNSYLDDFKEFKDLSYPPRERVLKFNRLNKPFQSVLYGSDSKKLSVEEIKTNWFLDSQYEDVITVTISEWIINIPLKVIIIPDFTNPRMGEINEKSNLSDESEEVLLFLNFINKIFRENSFYNCLIYKLTAAFSDALRWHFDKKGEDFDGILYTSAQDGEGWNVALETHVVDSEVIKIRDVEKRFFKKVILTQSYNKLEKIIKPKHIDFQNKKIIWEDDRIS